MRVDLGSDLIDEVERIIDIATRNGAKRAVLVLYAGHHDPMPYCVTQTLSGLPLLSALPSTDLLTIFPSIIVAGQRAFGCARRDSNPQPTG